MGLGDIILGFLYPVIPYLAVLFIVLAAIGLAMGGLQGGTTAGVFWLAIVFGLVGIMLFLSGYEWYGVLSFLVAFLIAIADGYHERRYTRRAHARMVG